VVLKRRCGQKRNQKCAQISAGNRTSRGKFLGMRVYDFAHDVATVQVQDVGRGFTAMQDEGSQAISSRFLSTGKHNVFLTQLG
jgi:hypothetical protein